MSRARSSEPSSKSMPADGNRGRLGFVFPGQGSQHPGMGKRIAEISPAAQASFAEADEALDFSISDLCAEGSEADLLNPVNTPPAVVATSVAYLAYLRELAAKEGGSLEPALIAGHSLGQFTAAIAANALDFGDGIRLVRERGRIMMEWTRKHPGGLVTVLGLDEAAVGQLCEDASPDGKVGVAVLNGPGQTVISGETAALERAMVLTRERGGRALLLPISTPGHTPLMRDAARDLSHVISQLTFRAPDPPLVSNISARPLTTAEEVRRELADQICAPVRWADCVRTMIDAGVTSVLEVGPGHALSKLVRRIDREIDVMPVESAAEASILELVSSRAGSVAVASAEGGSAR